MLIVRKLFYAVTFQKSNKMSVFIQKLNPITGINDWVVQNEDYDYHQEVARASFADMLHDKERNELYERALQSAIEKMHANGVKANVLDIGTGTGLLSMMAARHGADTVTACEAFKPMSECALKIIAQNGYQDKITVIPKRSTDLTVSDQGDLKQRCNILVTEVFDTELIGEGALSTFSHAHKNLLEKNCIIVPQSATIYAQIVECPMLQNWNKLKDIYNNDGKILISVPASIKNCAGSAAVHDVQLSQMPLTAINTIVPPTPVLRFDWSGRTPFVFERSTISNLKAARAGKAQAVFMWWDLQMDTDNKIVLSCAPHWAHPLTTTNKTASIPWRDHWMQAIYYFPAELTVKEGEEINLISCHDEYSLWFNLSKDLRITDVHYLNPICECGLHVSFARTRIGQMNDQRRNKKYLSLLQRNVTKDSCILVLSDGFYLTLAAAKMGAKKLYYIETNVLSRRILQDFVQFNNIDNVEIIDSLEKLKEVDLNDVNMVLGEPYFISSILPWDNLLFVYLVTGVQKLLKKGVSIFPKRAVIKAVAVRFQDLYKIRSPLGKCQGFSMKDFDELIEESSNISDDNVEAQPLWEYPGIALSDEVQLASIDLMKMPDTIFENNGLIEIKGTGDCNGIALWIDWWMEDDAGESVITTGPIQPSQINENIQWDMYTRQGVCLFYNKTTNHIKYNFVIDFNGGNISFNCN